MTAAAGQEAAAPAPGDERFMGAALALAARGLGRVAPNPAVGCLIVREGRVVGRGWTQPGGAPHAETVALAAAGPDARGATAYVTLEPCAHHGRTPPCAEALVAAGIARCVFGLVDPDPRVAGRGLAILREAGIAVAGPCREAEAAALNAGFLVRLGLGRPRVTLKLAQSLDGGIATASGESRWITGPLARREVHLARAQSDAILVGGGTARADDPALDVRDLGLADRAPIRVVAAGRLAIPSDSRLALTARRQPLWLCHGPDAPDGARARWRDLGAELIEVPRDAAGGLDLGALLRRLGERGLNVLLCEGGAGLAAGLARAGLVDEIVLYCAPILIGGDGLRALGPLGLEGLAAAPRFRLAEIGRIGDDLRARWVRT